MSSKFKNVPVEKGTRIHLEKEMKINDMDILHQVWSWDGVHAESIIFCNEDVQHHSDDQVQAIVVGISKRKFRRMLK